MSDNIEGVKHLLRIPKINLLNHLIKLISLLINYNLLILL